MKKAISIILCLMMICTATVSFAAELTLPVKMQRQMQHEGNGVKGTIEITANAGMAEHPLIYTIQNATYSILRNMSGEQWHLTVFQTDGQEQQINRTELYQGEEGVYLRSDFLPERVFLLPEAASLIPDNGVGENPSIIPVLFSLLSMKDAEKNKWEPVIRKYGGMLETWIAAYAATPELEHNPDGTVQMKLIYIVPADELKNEIISLVRTAAADPDVTALLAGLLTEEQKAIYLNGGLEYYYREVLASLRFTDDMRLVKTVTTMGEIISSELTLPMDSTLTGYDELTVFSRESETGYILRSGTELIQLTVSDGLANIGDLAEYDGSAYILYRSTAEDRKDRNVSVSLSVHKTTENYDDEETGKGHEIEHYTVHAERDTANLPEGVNEEDIPEFETIDAEADLHYSGKPGPNSPTTLEASVLFRQGAFNLQITGKIKTAKTWPFVPFSTDGATPLAELGDEEKAAALAEWIQTAAGGIVRTETAEGGTEE